jgi:hypothetical protein
LDQWINLGSNGELSGAEKRPTLTILELCFTAAVR